MNYVCSLPEFIGGLVREYCCDVNSVLDFPEKKNASEIFSNEGQKLFIFLPITLHICKPSLKSKEKYLLFFTYLDKTRYLVCNVQCKMKMWDHLLKIIENFKTLTVVLRKAGPF